MTDEERLNRIIALMFTTSRLIRERVCATATTGKKFSFVQMHALRFVNEHTDLPMKYLAEYLSITPATTTSLIQFLVGAGLVDRTFDKTDRRVIYLFVTKKGKNVLETHMHESAVTMRDVLSTLDSSEQEHLIHILEKMSAGSAV